jgi:hypothetical protein
MSKKQKKGLGLVGSITWCILCLVINIMLNKFDIIGGGIGFLISATVAYVIAMLVTNYLKEDRWF